ncbi:hypothetical protein Taro_055688, partial [Colocasia esculenta]|nr:hypothetical protein [Colocasia esculenta]
MISRRVAPTQYQVQEHNNPHILLLQVGNTFCKLPGGRLKPGENGKILVSLLNTFCGNDASIQMCYYDLGNFLANLLLASSFQPNWQEFKKLFLVHLSEREYVAVPKKLKLLAVPLFELFDNVQRYGPVISTIYPTATVTVPVQHGQFMKLVPRALGKSSTVRSA